MAARTFQFKTADQTGLQVYAWEVAGSKRPVLITHGLGEHALRYSAVAQFFNNLGFSVYGYDLRGHGASMGKRGAIPNLEDLASNGFVHDLVQVFDEVTKIAGQAPFVLGHSLGGLITARFVTTELRTVPGAILTSPALGLRTNIVTRLMLKYLPAIVPNLGLPNGLKLENLSHDAQVVAAYKADPMVHGVVTPRLAAWMVTAIAAVQACAAKLSAPTLLLYASHDPLVDPAGSALFAMHAPKTMLQAHEISGAYHEVLNESPQWRDPTLAYIHEWLNQQPTKV